MVADHDHSEECSIWSVFIDTCDRVHQWDATQASHSPSVVHSLVAALHENTITNITLPPDWDAQCRYNFVKTRYTTEAWTLRAYMTCCMCVVILDMYLLFCCYRLHVRASNHGHYTSTAASAYSRRGLFLVYRTVSDLIGVPFYVLLLISLVSEYSSDWLYQPNMQFLLLFVFIHFVLSLGFIYVSMAIMRLVAVSRPLLYQTRMGMSLSRRIVCAGCVVSVSIAAIMSYTVMFGAQQVAKGDKAVEVQMQVFSVLGYINMCVFVIVLVCWLAVLCLLARRHKSRLRNQTERALVNHTQILKTVVSSTINETEPPATAVIRHKYHSPMTVSVNTRKQSLASESLTNRERHVSASALQSPITNTNAHASINHTNSITNRSNHKLNVQLLLFLVQSVPSTILSVGISLQADWLMDTIKIYQNQFSNAPCTIDVTRVQTFSIVAACVFAAPVLRALLDPAIDLCTDTALSNVKAKYTRALCVCGTPRLGQSNTPQCIPSNTNSPRIEHNSNAPTNHHPNQQHAATNHHPPNQEHSTCTRTAKLSCPNLVSHHSHRSNKPN